MSDHRLRRPEPGPFEAELLAALPYLKQVGRRLARSEDGADDLVQDGVERALRKRDRYRGDGSLQSWIAAIMTNIRRSELRRNERRGVHDDLDDCGEAICVPPCQPAYFEAGRVWRKMRMLPGREQRALYFVGVRGESHIDFARREGIAPGTVKSRLSRARSRLAE